MCLIIIYTVREQGLSMIIEIVVEKLFCTPFSVRAQHFLNGDYFFNPHTYKFGRKLGQRGGYFVCR